MVLLVVPAVLLSVLRWLYVVESMSLSPELPVVMLMGSLPSSSMVSVM